MAQDKIVFVLWADRFDETLAALFVAELRKAGLRVKLVSLAGQPSSGAYGLTLVPDLTLEQALPMAQQASCVVIPCGDAGLKRLKNDPRIQQFLVQTHAAGAMFVVDQSGVVDLERGGLAQSELTVHENGKEMDFLRAVRQIVAMPGAKPSRDAIALLAETS
jgi:transcriptional regulator GlxA family with amidase domain